MKRVKQGKIMIRISGGLEDHLLSLQSLKNGSYLTRYWLTILQKTDFMRHSCCSWLLFLIPWINKLFGCSIVTKLLYLSNISPILDLLLTALRIEKRLLLQLILMMVSQLLSKVVSFRSIIQVIVWRMLTAILAFFLK